MLRESVDTTPRRNDQRIEELLAAAGAAQPVLADEKENGKQDTVSDEGAAHDEMGQALSEMVVATKTQRSDAPKKHLHPAQHRHCLAEDTMQNDENPANPSMNSPLYMQFKVDAYHNLCGQEEHQGIRERSVDIFRELAAFMRMTEKVCDDSNSGPDDLNRYVPS